MKKIGLPDWLPLKLLEKVFGILSGIGESRLVGGCVRDILLGDTSKDLDIATTAHPEQVLKILLENNIKAIPTGLKHGTITAIIENYALEITTLRKDIECYGRHAKVEFTNEWEEDAKRRDFTINAMSSDLEGNIYDYFEGQKDLFNRVVKFVGDPEKRISEDYLRILRYFRFYAYFGGTNIDNASLAAASWQSSKLVSLSGERIRQEMFKLLEKKYALDAIRLMVKTHVWEYLDCAVPNINILQHYVFSSEALINLAAIIRTTASPQDNIERIRRRWRLSNKEKAMLEILCSEEYEPNGSDMLLSKKALYFLKKDDFLLKLKLQAVEEPKANQEGLYKLVHDFVMPTFPLGGKDLKKLGFQGKEIGEKILIATNAWINSNFRLKKEELLEMVKKV